MKIVINWHVFSQGPLQKHTKVGGQAPATPTPPVVWVVYSLQLKAGKDVLETVYLIENLKLSHSHIKATTILFT